jgi:hypothetical protein
MSINPNGGQIFIEINFFEGTDYDINSGLLKINKNIEFYLPNTQPENVLSDEDDGRVTGLVYMVLSVVSSFSKGRFTQDLDLVLWSDPTVKKTKGVNSQGRETTSNQAEQLGTNVYGFGNQEFPVAQSSQEQQSTPNTYWQPTQQSISAQLNTNSATDAESTIGNGVAFNQQRAFNGATVVDDDSIQSDNLATDFIRANQEGRTV